tara:strand:- start:3433 stop:4182 length:750 start_codon:yes stop_codon:yes gene_type:complete
MTSPEAINFALSYPYERPKDDFIYINGHSYKLSDRDGHDINDWRVQTGSGKKRIADLIAKTHYETDFSALIPVIAVGSNGSPVQLRRKFYTKHDTMIPTLMMTLENWTATYCRFISGYGAVPATITRHDGCQSILPVNFVDAATFKLLNNSEGLGEFYNLLEIDTRDLTHPEFKTFDTIYAYKALDEGFNFRLDGFEVIGCDLPTYTQWEMQQHIIDSMKLDTDVVSFIIANIEDADRRHMIGDKMKKI